LRAGELCLVWGAAGGLGLFAIQLAKYVGANVIAVVSNELRAQECLKLGADAVVNRSEMKHKLLDVNGVPNLQSLREYKKSIEKIGLGLPDVVFEHVGRETLALSVFLARRGGRIVTCAATSGAESQIDLRYLWLGVKRIIGSHIATHEEAISANKLITAGSIKTTVSTTGTLEDVPQLLTDLADGVITGKAVVRI
jgi:crotonyl-CoA reductase